MLVVASGGDGNPDVIASVSRRSSCRIFRDVEVAVLVERQIIRQFEIGRRIHTDPDVIVNEGRLMTPSALWFA